MDREFTELQGMKHFTDLDDSGRREWTEETFGQRSHHRGGSERRAIPGPSACIVSE